MILYGVIPPPAGRSDLTDDADRHALMAALAPPSGPWVRAVLVTTSAGEMWGPDGTSTSVTRGADRTLLGLHRGVCDAVVVGARTIKAEQVPLPLTTPLVVVSASGDLRGHQLAHPERGGVIVLTSSSGAGRVTDSLGDFSHRIVVLDGSPAFGPEEIVDALGATLGAESLLIEGGRALFETFASITDEVALSVTPPPRSERAGVPPWWPEETGSWTLTSLMTDDDKMLYYRYLTGVRGAPS